jgi:hypothetical protein
MDGSREYIEQEVADSSQGVVFELLWLGGRLTTQGIGTGGLL